jgi:hypothetical protein
MASKDSNSLATDRSLSQHLKAISSNPLSSTRKSARATVGSVFQESLKVLMG